MNSIPISSVISGGLPRFGISSGEEVVEIDLLLPKNRAEALLELARVRGESVAQVLRKLIERELADPLR